jgi:hypothetical protein
VGFFFLDKAAAGRVLRFSPVIIIQLILRIRLYLHVALTKRSKERNLGTFKAKSAQSEIGGEFGRKVRSLFCVVRGVYAFVVNRLWSLGAANISNPQTFESSVCTCRKKYIGTTKTNRLMPLKEIVGVDSENPRNKLWQKCQDLSFYKNVVHIEN